MSAQDMLPVYKRFFIILFKELYYWLSNAKSKYIAMKVILLLKTPHEHKTTVLKTLDFQEKELMKNKLKLS